MLIAEKKLKDTFTCTETTCFRYYFFIVKGHQGCIQKMEGWGVGGGGGGDKMRVLRIQVDNSVASGKLTTLKLFLSPF